MKNANKPIAPFVGIIKDNGDKEYIHEKDPVDSTFKSYNVNYPGLTKREYFAAMAMQGLLSRGEEYQKCNDETTLAKQACKNADALLKELES